MSQQKEIFIRIDRCTGCRSCEVACAVEHSTSKSLFAAISESPVPRKRLYIEPSKEYNIPLLCRHCEDAPCMRACKTGALSQDATTRVVSHDPDKCIGCWMCTMVCPYGVIGRLKEQRVAVKCDLRKEMSRRVWERVQHMPWFIQKKRFFPERFGRKRLLRWPRVMPPKNQHNHYDKAPSAERPGP
jgi:carbon-monoxide dehydrogenase iron sulfur subunit